jgi:hypothetical protein
MPVPQIPGESYDEFMARVRNAQLAEAAGIPFAPGAQPYGPQPLASPSPAPAEQYGPPPPPGYSPFQMAKEDQSRAQFNQKEVMKQAAAPLQVVPNKKFLNTPSPDPIEKGSGMSAKNSTTSTSKNHTAQTNTIWMDPETLQTQYDAFSGMPANRAMDSGLSSLEALAMEQSQRKPALDLRIPAALIDSLTGSNFIRAVDAPETRAERDKMIFDHAQKIQQDKRDLAKSRMDMVLKGKAGTESSATDKIIQLLALRSAEDPAKAAKSAIGSATQVLGFQRATDRESKELRTRGELIDTALRLLNGSPAEQQSIPTLSARIIEGTVRPQLAVIRSEGGDPSSMMRLEALFEKMSKGEITPENKAQYNNMFKQLADQHVLDAAGMKRRWKVAADSIGLSPEQMNEMVGSHWLDPHRGNTEELLKKHSWGSADANDALSKSAPAPAPAAKSGVKSKEELLKMSDAEFDAYEKARLGK